MEVAAAAAQQPLRKLLIPVDDTDDSEIAVSWLIQHLHRNGADELHFMHVVPFNEADFAAVYGVPPIDYVPVPVTEGQKLPGVAHAEKFIFKRFVLKLPQDLQPRPVVHIVKSETSKQHIGELICSKASELGAAVVVMSSHNKGMLKELFLGSVANYCLHHSRAPLVVVPPKWRHELAPAPAE